MSTPPRRKRLRRTVADVQRQIADVVFDDLTRNGYELTALDKEDFLHALRLFGEALDTIGAVARRTHARSFPEAASLRPISVTEYLKRRKSR